MHPGNSWDLKSCCQKPDESLRDFIRCFSKQCTELPRVGDSEIVQAFLSGTSCRDLVRELGRNVPTTAAALLDIATNFASGEEAIGAIFPDKDAKGKRRDEAPGALASRFSKKRKRGARRSKRPSRPILSRPWIAGIPEAPPEAPDYLTIYSRSRALTTKAR